MTKYTVEAAHTQEDVENRQCVVVNDFDTLKEAKGYAKYLLTDQCMRDAESTQPLGYVRIIEHSSPGFTCVADYFRK